MASGHPFYLSFIPKNIYPSDNQRPELVNQHAGTRPDIPLYPDHVALGARPDQGPFAAAGVQRNYRTGKYDLYLQDKPFIGVNDTLLYLTTYQPPNGPLFNQGVQPARVKGKQKSGNAPTSGVYTGYQLESYSYYGGVDYTQEEY